MKLNLDVDLSIPKLGKSNIPSPLATAHAVNMVDDHKRVLFTDRMDRLEGVDINTVPCYERAGPRREIFFDPSKTVAGIVTCGGLCPGLNDVIRGLVMELYYGYGVQRIIGYQYGYEGLAPKFGHAPIDLTPKMVTPIHETGGTILGTSRGSQDTGEMVDTLHRMGVNMVFTIGGDGTQRAALEMSEEIRKRKLLISVIGVPKTIDNDILYMDKSFGFETAFGVAYESVLCAHTEARCARNGIGLVKLMGRDSGWIATSAALATSVANVVLIPEVPFEVEPLLNYIQDRLERRHHVTILAAEGAGQDLFKAKELGLDKSGNAKFHDIGLFLKEQLKTHLTAAGIDHTIKYIDPSYMLRAVKASPGDSLYALRLAQGAVHAAMSGRTEMVIGRVRKHYVHLPMPLIATGRKKVRAEGDDWLAVLESTGQPARFE